MHSSFTPSAGHINQSGGFSASSYPTTEFDDATLRYQTLLHLRDKNSFLVHEVSELRKRLLEEPKVLNEQLSSLRKQLSAAKAEVKVLNCCCIREMATATNGLPLLSHVEPTLDPSKLIDVQKEKMFWMQDIYIKSLQSEGAFPEPPGSLKGKCGKTRLSVGINDTYPWVVDRDGKPVDGYQILAMLENLRQLWAQLKVWQRLPDTYGKNSPLDVKRFIYHEMVNCFPVLGYCENNWKTEAMAIGSFGNWIRVRGRRVKKEDTESDDESMPPAPPTSTKWKALSLKLDKGKKRAKEAHPEPQVAIHSDPLTSIKVTSMSIEDFSYDELGASLDGLILMTPRKSPSNIGLNLMLSPAAANVSSTAYHLSSFTLSSANTVPVVTMATTMPNTLENSLLQASPAISKAAKCTGWSIPAKSTPKNDYAREWESKNPDKKKKDFEMEWDALGDAGKKVCAFAVFS
ncbi:hypothetical protein NEOLEDRAFT_1173060 [Neolentinus lepideus HHB14362 ss-1]|uniref:Uncharacterized protein n=1 Tax=Neolentinus lepideus HHB14362 ss-1 TaxID=1314782 RepID=A0A165NBK2_9AGAM|nr:hypothetical protein NEOLEDRAFT_1173060 [Neolentinus lepideus HHB14362 ss-1]